MILHILDAGSPEQRNIKQTPTHVYHVM